MQHRAATDMRVTHAVPHRLPASGHEGHAVRNAVLRQAFPDLRTAAPGEPITTDTVLVDTFLRHELPRGVRTVLLARGLNEPEPRVTYALRLTWPYEGELGDIIPPLVPVAPAADRDIAVLVVPSRFSERFDWAGLARAVGGRLVGGEDAAPLMARSRVVVGGGGTGTLYGALWAGCAYVIARMFTREQRTRGGLAIAGGEPVLDGSRGVVDAVRRALRSGTFPARANGVQAIREAVL